MKQLEMKLTLDGEEAETFMEIALAIQNHLQNLEELTKQQTQEDDQ
jgi:hypothetical protein